MHHREFRKEGDIPNSSVAHFVQGDCKILELGTLIDDEENLALRAALQALPNLPR